MEPITLIAAYAIPLACLVWLWLGNIPGWRGKLLITLILPLIYLLHWQGIQDNKGWPAHQVLPEKFELLAADIVEPRKTGARKGAIHLWIRESDTEEPRVYALPYTRKLHETLHTTRQRMEQGRSQVGLLIEDDGSGKGAGVGNGQRLEFRDRAAGLLPPKRRE